MHRIRSLLALCVAPTVACSDSAFDRPLASQHRHVIAGPAAGALIDEGADDPDAPLRHLLSDITLLNGKVPVLEVSDSPSGHKYGLYVASYSLEEQGGDVVNERGYQELVVRPNDGAEGNDFLPVPSTPVIKVDPRIRDQMATGASRVSVLLWLKEPALPMLFLDLQRRVFRGDVTTRRERDELRAVLEAERQAVISDVQDQVLSAVGSLGETMRCINNPCVLCSVSADGLALLEADDNVELIESVEDGGEPEAPLGSANIIANQTEPWWDWGYAGHGINGNEAIIALVDEGFPNEEHIAFTDGPGTGARIVREPGAVPQEATLRASFRQPFQKPMKQIMQRVLLGSSSAIRMTGQLRSGPTAEA